MFVSVPAQLAGEQPLSSWGWKLTIQTHKHSLSNKVPIHSWVERVYTYTGELPLPEDTVPRRGNQDLRARDLSIQKTKVAAIATTLQCPPCMYGAYHINRDTKSGHPLSAPGLCISRSQCTVFLCLMLSKVSETAPTFTWSCEPLEGHSLQLEG